MDRRAFIVGGVAALAAPLATEAQQAGKVYRIGVLSPDVPPPPSWSKNFKRACASGVTSTE
jgi:hypothetical protein